MRWPSWHAALVRVPSRCGIVCLLLASLLAAACADPPNKEMDQAQGAIDAARAAGAERYASGEYMAAVDALRLAHDAVADGDYRLALNYALESRERAQNAARDAADTRARVRSEVERAMAAVDAGLARAEAQLAAADPKVPRPAREEAEQALARIRSDVQEAGTAMAADDYLAAQPLLDGKTEQIDEVIASLEQAAVAQTPRPR